MDYILRLTGRNPKVLSQFIDTSIETKRTGIARLFEDFPGFQLLLPFL